MGLNHVYKVIWNKTKGCYVVVSELAKRVGRNKAKAIVMSTAAMAMAVSPVLTSTVGAALNDPGTGNGAVAWGTDSKTTAGDSVAIGKGPTASGSYAVAIGASANAGRTNAVAMGNQATATGDNSTALGRLAKATGNDTVAVGNSAEATSNETVAIGLASKATADRTVALGKNTKASANEAVAIAAGAQATAARSIAFGKDAKATQSSAVAIGDSAEATGDDTVAIGKEAKATQPRSIAIGQTAKVNGGQDTVAIGTNAQVNNHKSIALGRDSQATAEFSMALGAQSQATATRAIALGTDAKAQSDQAVAIGSEASAVQPRSIAIGKYARVINGQDTVVIGTDTEAQGHGSIIIGKNAKTKNDAQGTVVIGRDAFSEGSGDGDRPNTVIGRGAYTAFGEDGNYRLNASTAIGFQAGAGVIRESNDNRKLVNNNTNADNNAEVLVKAGYGVDANAPAETKTALQSGTVHNGLVFYRQKHINEGTAIGVESRAVGDQSIAIGGQVVAGDGVVALGGNDITMLDGNKYQVVTDNAVRRTNVDTVDDYNLAYTESRQTVGGQFRALVGRGLSTAYKSTYGQSGSVVIGMQAHSTTALGTAIGTNAAVRMGAFGATAIGAGSTVQPNAEAAVAIGMGSVANGAYALAAGTASWAELGDIAMGYKAKASGQQGAIAIGQATNAQGDSSVMIGGANISNAADQATRYEAERKNPDGSRVTYTKDVTERINGQNVTRKYTYVSTETKNGTVADAYAELTGKTMNTASLDYNDPNNRNGHASTSIGVHSLAKGNLASAYGASSRASAIGSLALGTGAIADKQNAVAIGTGSTTDLTGTRQLDASYDKEGKWVASDSPNAAYTFKWAGGLNTAEGDVVSFGSSGAERQLKNVAAGRIAEDSTDAINGSQVNAVIERFIGERVKYFSVNSTVEPNRQNDGATGTNAIAIGPNATATKTDGVATGNGATATGDRATAYGAGTTASAVNAVAVGSTVTVTEGTTTTEVATKADAASATALGAGAQATAMDSTAVGTLSEAKAAEAIAVGAKAKSESAASVAIGQNANASTAATQGVAVGQNASVTVAGGVAVGAGSVASVASGVSGIGVDDEAEGTARVNKYAKLHDDVDHALTSGQGAVSVGGTLNNTPFTRQITGVAAGTNDTDAVNVAQLKSVNLAFKGNTGTGDVRLHDQRLTVESDNTNLLTVTASDKKLTITPKTTSLTIDSTAGSTTLGKVTVPDTTNNALVTAADVANAINAAHWNVATDLVANATGAKHEGDSTAAVHAGETVKFIAGEHVTIHQDGRNITVSMKDAVTNIMVKDQIQSSFENGDNTSFSVNPTTGKFRYDVSSTPTYTSITTGKSTLKDGVVTNLDSHLPNSEGPTVQKPTITEEVGKQAATVSDVMNAGWHLQNNGTAKDFVKPYDVVTFNDGASTTAIVTTSADKLTSTVTYNVTGLPISYTTEAGTPVSKVGDKYYTVDETGTPVGPTGNKAVGKNASGDYIDDAGNVITPINPNTTPLKSNLVNPNVSNTTSPNTSTTTPTQLGNVANGGVTHNLRDANGTELALANDGNYYDATKVNPDGSPMTGVTTADAKTPVVLANDGKWYPKDKVSDRGELKDPTATPVVHGITAAAPTAGLVNFDKSNPNNAATIGDLRNMGWVVSAPTNGYLDQVRNANQVDFVGKNGVVVTGETKNGIRTITVETAEEAVVFKGPDGTSLIKTEKGYVPENSVKIDGNYYPPNTTKDPVTGNIVNNGAPATPVTPVPKEDVVTSMNSNTPKTLNNVKNTLPNVNDETKTITTPDGQEQPNAGDVSNINRAPLTAAQAAELSNPKTADGQPNPNYKGSNAATVSDVLNAGWNLQTNGTALDFVKPYDTVNFADGGNTTVVSSTDGTTSKIQVNVTGLPVSNTVTDANGKQVPVTKVGNTYFPVKADGTPDIQRDADGNPTNGYTIADNGNIYPSNQLDFVEQPDGSKTVTPRGGTSPTTVNTNLSNPNVPQGNPTEGVNTPTPLGNVSHGATTINPISTTGVPLKKANDGKWYDATKVDDQGNPTVDAGNFEGTPAVLGNDGKWYEAGKVDEKGTPKADAQPILNPLTNKTANGGLVNFANSNPHNAATVGDLQNMGWIVGAPANNYADQVRNANQVNFEGKNLAIVTGKTDDKGIRTITVDVQAQRVVEEAHTPVVYTDKDGNKLTKLDNGKFYDAKTVKALGTNNITEIDGKLYPADAVTIDGKLYPNGTVKVSDGVFTNPKGLGVEELKGIDPVTITKASMNTTDDSTTNPFPLANVGSNLKQVVDPKDNIPGKVNDVDGETKVGDTTNAAPYTAAEAANLAQRYQLNDDGTIKTEKVPVIDPKTGKQKVTKTKQVDPQTGVETEVETPVFEDKKLLNPNYIGNNAATVSDVLNAGWNLQNNGAARDFVKPYDTVNFVNGANTTAVVTTNAAGTASDVTFNVTGLPVTYTDADGKPVSKVGDKFYKVNDKGQPISDAGKPAVKTNDDGKLVDEDNNVIEPIDPTATPLKTALTNAAPANGKTATTSPTALNNVTSNLSNYTEPVKNGLRNLDNKDVSNNTAATVGDLRNMGWIVSSDKKTGDLGKAYSDTVKNANEVKFVGTGMAVVSGKTDDATGVRTITVNVDSQTSANNAVTPVVYTKADGTQVYPIKDENGVVRFHTTPDGKGTADNPDTVVDNGDVVTSVNGPNGTKGENAPTTLKNVKNNIPNVNDGDKKAYNVDGTPIADKNNTAAPITAQDAADLLKPMKDGVANPKFVGNNAATVSDVLNAGWNLQGNGKAVDFVKPYDTVNFRNGGNTTVTVTTDDNLTSHVQVNVTGLPVANTITDPTTGKQVPVVKVGDTFYPANPDGTPNIQKDAATGEPTNGYVRADDGKFYPREDVDITPNAADPTQSPTVTPKAGKTPTTVNTNLANPNVANTTDNPGNNVNTPSQLGNVANGAKTFAPVAADGTEATDAKPAVKLANDGKWYPADKVEANGKPKDGATPLTNSPLAPKNADGDVLEKGNDGKWYKAADLTNGKPADNAVEQTPVARPANAEKSGLIDFTNSNPNNAATVGDLQNMGWVVSAEGNNYSDQVRNANEVKFVGEGTATVTGKTDANGVRTITVKVDDQVSTNNAVTPVVYTKADGTQVYPIKDEHGNVKFHTTPDGKGTADNPDTVVDNGDVVTSVNGPNGTKGENAPTTLKNVKNNIPNVNDGTEEITKPDGTVDAKTPNKANITKAPLTAEQAANLSNPKTKDGAKNPNYIGNNAATVSDVLNAGWNLQNNGTAKDFVKPFDTVNFVNGANTTAVVTTAADGTTSDVTYNVTGLPITYTTADGAPVSKIGDKFYKVNDKGQPLDEHGNPSTKVNNEGKPVDDAGNVINPINTTDNPLQSNLVNPNAPDKQTTIPTQLGNVANGANTFAPVDNKVLANDGKWYNATDVAPNGKPKDGVTPADKPENVGKEGLIDFENSKPNNAATVGDLQNLGFVVSAKDNGYTDQVRNANKVEFKGTNGVEVTGKTLEDGTREITVGLKAGKVTNDVIVTKEDGTETHGVRGEDGKVYEKDPVTGKATPKEIPVGPKDTIKNDGDSFVNGNAVATAIEKSGWNVGIGSTDKAFSTEAKAFEKVNPNDNVKYVNGANTTVSMAVDAAEDKDGTKVTTTYVKVDVNRDLKIDSVTTGGTATDKNGNNLVKVGEKYYKEGDVTVVTNPDGSTTVTPKTDAPEVPTADVIKAKDGAMTVKDAKGKDGVSATAKDGKGTLTLNNADNDKDGKDGKNASQVNISAGKGPADLANTPKDGADVPTMDRIQYTDKAGNSYNVATLNDGLRFVGDDDKSIEKPLNSTLTLTGGDRADTGKPVAKDATTTGNIGVFNTDGKLSIQLAKDLDKLNSANFESKADKAGNPLKKIGDVYYPENAKIIDGKVYPEGTVIIDNKPYPAGTTKDAAGNVVTPMGQPAKEATVINPTTEKDTQAGPTSTLTGTGLTFNTPIPKDENGKELVLVDGKYYKADNLENGKPKADAKPEPVKPAQTTAFTPDGLVVTPETAKVKDANGNPVYDEHGRETIDPKKVVSFGAPTIARDEKGNPILDKNGDPVMNSGISAGGQVMKNVAPGVEDTDAVNVSQLKGVSNMVVNINGQMNRLGAQAAAMAGLRHLQYDPLEPTTIMAGIGTYKGETALALGIAHYKNESTLFHAGAAIGSHGDELMANAGVSWKFGARADETAVKDTFRQGPISASYTLQDKVSALEAQNQMQKNEINDLKAQLAEVLQYIKKG